MATANFKTMEDFPLIVSETPYCIVCPECGAVCGTDAVECDNCGTSLKGCKETIDELSIHETSIAMCDFAIAENDRLTFHKVTVEDGYYVGMQFYVDCDCNPHELDNEDCQYEWGLCRSMAIRKFDAEKRKIVKALHKAAKELGLIELEVAGRFSNGEVVYTRAESKVQTATRPVVKAA